MDLECASAIRLERAADVALRQIGGWGIYRGLELLRVHDSRAIAETMITITANSTPKNRKSELATLLQIGATKPNVQTAVLAAIGKAPRTVQLAVLSRMQPRSPVDRSEMQAAQLSVAGAAGEPPAYRGSGLDPRLKLTAGEAGPSETRACRDWRTRAEPFAGIWETLLHANPNRQQEAPTPHDGITEKHPRRLSRKHSRGSAR